MAVEEDDPRLVFLPIKVATTPPAGECHVVVGAYWAVHPERGLAFWASGRRAGAKRRPYHLAPQYNHDSRISLLLTRDYPWAEVRQIPSVFYRLDHDGGPVLPPECYG